jgi:GNAT superfamily N-acetyltransferase
MKMRAAGLEDVALLARLNRELAEDVGDHILLRSRPDFEARMRALLAEGHQAVIFEEDDGGRATGAVAEAAAYALYLDRGDEIYLRQFYVSRDRRRRGVGRRALALLMNEAWPPDRRLTVDTFAANQAGLAFWRSVGFRDHLVSLKIESEERRRRD